jgi:hypothetical protein
MTESVRGTTFDPRRPFTRAEARAAGISLDALLGPRFQKICWDTYLSRDVAVTPQIRSRAALKLAPPGTHISHETAAQLWGATVPGGPTTHITTPSGDGRLVRKGIKSHYYETYRPATTTLKGLPLSTPEQTFLDLASSGMSLVDLVVVLDGLLKAKQTTVDALVTAADGWHGRGRRMAQRAAGLARNGVDSPMETRLRLLIVLSGLPEPRVNLIVRDQYGEWKRRYDLVYEGLRLIVEYDGRQHARDDHQWLTDIFRREELDRMHWRLVIVTWHGIYREPLQTLERVRDALIQCGATGIRRRFKPEWRLHFAGRD